MGYMDSNSLSVNDALPLHLGGKLDEAEAIYRRILSAEPGNSEALHLLGVIAYQRQQYVLAEDLIGRAISINKRVSEYRNNLGNVYLAQKLLDKAEECYRKALKLNPKYADAQNNLATVVRDRGKFQESAVEYRKALRLDPTRAEIHNNLGMVMEGLRRTDEAIDLYREAIRLKPDFWDAYSNLAAAMMRKGRPIEALAICSKVLEQNPSHAKTLLNTGDAYAQLGQIDKGAVCYRKALLSQPDFCEAHLNLAHALREEGEKEQAVLHFRQAVKQHPTSLAARLGECIGQIPLLHDSVEEIAETRQRYESSLEKLSQEIDLSNPRTLNQAAHLVGNCQPFYLAYQGENDRRLQSMYGNLMVRIQSACFPSWSKKRPMPPHNPGEPLRIGILSGFYYLHSNWKIPIKGWAENLNRDEFQLFGYYPGYKVDQETEVARRSFFQFVENAGTTEQWCDRICRDRLHALIIPEVGMHPLTVRMASLRLAPIQCTSWGHPDTSGFPTIDYYLSSDLMEPADAQDHYTEKLVRLPNLSIYYEPLDIEPAPVDRSHFGLREGSVLFICTQSLFKYLPQFDEVFPRIAAEVGECQFAFLNYPKSKRLGEKFVRRLESAFARFGLRCSDYVKLLPHLTPPEYRTLNQVADVFLDSIGWSGCNSTMEALACDLPIVTMPGRLMRGRHTHAILQMMGCNETEARDLDEYVAIAKKLGTDAEYRKYISQKISRVKQLAYHDNACIRGLEEFLKSAVSSFS